MFIPLGFLILVLTSVTSVSSVSSGASCAPTCITYVMSPVYNYVNFIPFSVINGGRPVGYRIEFNFFAMGTQNFHVAITQGPQLGTNYYEIVYGNLGNTITEFRDRRGPYDYDVIATIDTPGILDPTNWRLFTLKLFSVATGGGNLEFYRDGSSVPFWAIPLPNADFFDHFSFTSDLNLFAQMKYNCPPNHCMGY